MTAADRVQKLAQELSHTTIAQLADSTRVRQMIGDLRQALGEIEAFANSLSGIAGSVRPAAPPAPARRKPGRPAASFNTPLGSEPPRGPGRRSKDGFRPTQWLLDTVAASGKTGISPKELVDRLVKDAPTHRANPRSLVSPLLNRLKKRGHVSNRDGRWFAVR